MKKPKTFRAPQIVQETIQKQGSMNSLSKSVVEGPMSFLRVTQIYKELSEALTESRDLPLEYGGIHGLRWSRRVLRQEGLLKSPSSGDVSIPEVVELQLGPTILAGIVNASQDEVVKEFWDAGIPMACLPVDGGSLIFCSIDKLQKNGYLPQPHFPVNSYDFNQIRVIDESSSKLRSILKFAGKGVVLVHCDELKEPVVFRKWQITPAFHLTVLDDAGVSYAADLVKVDDTLGLALGWAIVCTVDGEPYFDKQGDYIPDSAMLDAAVDFMQHSKTIVAKEQSGNRSFKEMHRGDDKGHVVFAWPMTAEIAKAYGIDTKQTGLMIAVKPDDPRVLGKFKDGTYGGFSIGGHRIPEHTEEVEI
jgi:hypothetical protein